MNKNASNLTEERQRRRRREVARTSWSAVWPATHLSANDLYVVIEAIDSYRARRSDASSGRPVALGVLREIVVDAMEDATRPVVPGDLGYALRLDRSELDHIAAALSEASNSWASDWDLEEAAATLARVQSSPAYDGSTAATGRAS